jgi:hypothetical protein
MAYWITSLALIIFGFLGSLSIGQPFLLVGLAMLVLGPFRGRPLVFWPPLLAVIAYNVAYFAVAPFYCSAGSTMGGTSTSTAGGTSTTVCSSLVGLRYSGEGIYNPSLVPAIVVGLVAAGLVALVVFALIRWKGRAEPGGPAA